MSDDIILDEKDFLDVFGESDDNLPHDVKTRITYFRDKINAMQEPATDEEVEAIIKMLGPRCKVSLLARVKAIYEKEIQRITWTLIPECFAQAGGIASMKFDDGTSVEVVNKLTTKTIDKQAAIAYITAKGYGDAVKTDLIFGKGMYTDGVAKALELVGAEYSIDNDVAPQTMKACITKIYEATGELPPESAIEVKRYKEAVFSKPKDKKGKF